jgi:hypothetical protein
MLDDRIEALLADKGYDADTIRAELAAAKVEAVMVEGRGSAVWSDRSNRFASR